MNAPTPELEPSGLEAELAAALEEVGRQVRPHEFDAHSILRHTARRRSARVLTSSAAGLAVIAGAAAFAADAHAGNTAPGASTSAATASNTLSSDPLTAPATFRTVPNGGAASGFTELGSTTQVGLSSVTGDPGAYGQEVQTEWISHGVDMTAQVSWFQVADPQSVGTRTISRTDVGTVNGHPAYVSDTPQRELSFWAGSQGYATLIIFANGVTDQSASVADLLNAARSVDPAPADVPMPIRVTGLPGVGVTDADMGWIGGGHADSAAWALDLRVTVDGRSYDISATPGAAATPSPTGTETSTGLVTAAENADGLGLTVSTGTGKEGSANAPTAAQVLAHVTSLGADPSGWTTDVIVP